MNLNRDPANINKDQYPSFESERNNNIDFDINKICSYLQNIYHK